MVDLNDGSVVNLGAVAAGDRFLVQRTGTDRGYIDGAVLAGATSNELEYVNVKAVAFGATGDGITDDTAAIQAAIDAAVEGAGVFFPPGTYMVDTLEVPHGKSLRFLGTSAQASVLRSRTVGTDIFHSDRGSNIAQDRFTTQHFYEHLTLQLNLPNGGADTAPNFDRCTPEGLAVGCAGIAYESSFLDTDPTPGPSGLPTWTNSHCHLDYIIIEAIDTTNGGFMNSCGVYLSGTSYGWQSNHVRLHDIDHGYVQTAPFVRRVTVNTGTNTLTHSGGTYATNATVTVTQHSGEGTIAAGINRHDDYFSVNTGNGTLQLSLSSGGGAVNITSAGTAPVYVMARDTYAIVIASDGCSIRDWTQYNGKSLFNLHTPENMTIERSDSYQITHTLIGCRSMPNGSRPHALSCAFRDFYSESPQTSALGAQDQARDPFVIIEGRGIKVDGLQVRGTDQQTGGADVRPRVEMGQNGSEIENLLFFSNLSAQANKQPELVVSGHGNRVLGTVHPSCVVTVTGSNNKVWVRNDDATATPKVDTL